MEKVEAEQELTTSVESKDAGVPIALEEDNETLLNICDNSIDTPDATNVATEKSITAETVCNEKSTEKIINSDSTKTETKSDDEDTKDEGSNEDTVHSAEQHNVEKKDSETPILKTESKVLITETVNDSPARIGVQRRRKLSLSAPDLDQSSEEGGSKIKRRKVKNPTDKFCWRCHKEYVDAHCTACPRAWHRKCIGGLQPTTSVQNWICGECATTLRAENAETRSLSMAQLSVDQLCVLLRYVVDRMREYPGSEPFWKPVEDLDAPNYQDYVVKPMDLSLLESNVRAKLYGSTDAFMADAKWIQHNCIVFNTCGGVYADTSKLTNAAKQMIKLARQEVSEIEACPDCYAHGRNIPRPQPSWFIEPCRRPHPLVWAKLKGFPFWPAKAMPRVNTQGFVDVRFFGQHDRAWVPPRDMYLYSEDPPVTPPRKRKLDMDECVREITRHCRKLELVFGQFKFAPPRMQYNPNDPMQIKIMLPNYDPLQPNNVISPLSTSKKKVAIRKRISLSKTKNQEVSDNTDSNPTATADCNTSADSTDENLKMDSEKMRPGALSDSKSDVLKFNESKEGTSLLPTDSIKVLVTNPTHSESKIKELVDERKVKIKHETTDQQENVKLDDANNKSNREEAEPVAKKNTESTLNIQVDNINLNILRNATKRASNSAEPLRKMQKIEKVSSLPSTKRITRLENSGASISVKKKESLSKSNTTEPEIKVSDGIANTQKQNPKLTKTVTKVYKPKTRMVDKVNAEKALSSAPINDGQKMNTEKIAITATPVRNGSELKDAIDKSNNQSPSARSILLNKSQLQRIEPSSQSPAVATGLTPKSNADQSVALLLVVNSGVSEPLKQSVPDQSRFNDTTGSVRQVLNDPSHFVTVPKKESKAKKSFPNKPRNYVHIAARPAQNAPANSNEPSIYIPTNQGENGIPYQVLPPEAGPLSARMHQGVTDLTKKMAQLMEEAYREAAQEDQTVDGGSSENHQATVHFLKLQMERMRWQHQQELTELKHSTDRKLREMRSALKADVSRAVDEALKEAEQEKTRCIQEIKRKQWCAMCGHEAVFYCCWNTAYCDYPCQTLHWPTHMRSCAQQPSLTTIVTSSPTNSQQLMPKLMMNAQHTTPNARRV